MGQRAPINFQRWFTFSRSFLKKKEFRMGDRDDRDGVKLFVYGINANCPRDLLEDTFEKCGKVNDIFNTGKGYAFVTMADERDAKIACEDLNGTELDGQDIKVEISRPKRRDDRDGGRRGGFGGGRRDDRSGGGRFGGGGFGGGRRDDRRGFGGGDRRSGGYGGGGRRDDRGYDDRRGGDRDRSRDRDRGYSRRDD